MATITFAGSVGTYTSSADYVVGNGSLLLDGSGGLYTAPDVTGKSLRYTGDSGELISASVKFELAGHLSESTIYGPAVLDSSGNGYAAVNLAGDVLLKVINAYAEGADLGSASITISPGEDLTLNYDPSTDQLVVMSGVTSYITEVDSTHTVGLGSALYVLSWDTSAQRIIEFTHSTGEPDAGIVNINAGSIQGGGSLTTTTVDFVPVSISVGDLVTTSLTPVNATTYTSNMPAMAEGYYPPFGSVTATAVNSTEEESTLQVTHVIQDGYTAVLVSSLSADESSIFTQMVSQNSTTMTVGSTIYFPSAMTVFADTTYADAPDGTQILFVRPDNSDVLYQINLVNGVVGGSSGHSKATSIGFGIGVGF